LRILRKKCLGNPQAGLIGKAESMSEAWVLLDGVFGDPTADARRLIEEFKALPGVRSKKDQRELYALIQDVIDEAVRQESEDLLLTPIEIGMMLRPLPPRERDRWFTWRVNSAPGTIAGVFITFIEDQWERANAQQEGERDRPVKRIPVPAPGQGGTGFKLSKRRRCKSTMNQARRLSRHARNRSGSKHPASLCNQPRRKHPWGSVGGWNVPRSKPMVTQPSPSKRPALLMNRDGMDQSTRRRRTLQLRADRGSVSPRADLKIINS
jgi:hypothetical protein